MLKRSGKALICLLLAILLLSASTVAASAASLESWVGTDVEQTIAFVPQLDIIMYPKNMSGNLLLGIDKASADISVTLDGEQMTVDSLESVSDVPTAYYFLLNVCDNNISFPYLRSIKEGLYNWVDHLNEGDKFVLMTIDEECRLVLDGSESREAAKTLINNIQTQYKVSNTAEALDKLIDIAAAGNKSLTPRKVLVMFDKGTFISDESSSVITALNAKLLASAVPLYAITSHKFQNVPELMSDLAHYSGGKAFDCSDGARQDSIVEDVRIWLESGYLLRTHGSSDDPNPTEREMKIVFSGANLYHALAFRINIDGHVTDTKAPTVLDFYCENEGRELHLKYSEPVSGADNEKCFSVTLQKNGKEMDIKNISYLQNTCETIIELDESVKDADYTLTVTKPESIRDLSYDANPLVLTNGGNYDFAVGEGSFATVKLYIMIAATFVLIVAIVLILISIKHKKDLAKKEAEKEAERKRIEAQHIKEDEEHKKREEEEKKKRILKLSLSFHLPDRRAFKKELELRPNQHIIIGRSEAKSNLAVPCDPSISGAHIALSYVDKKLLLTDVGSSNGTYVNAQRISSQYQLRNNEIITIGNTNIRVNY